MNGVIFLIRLWYNRFKQYDFSNNREVEMKAVRGSLNRNQCDDHFSQESRILRSSKTSDFVVIPSTNKQTEFGFTYKPTKINNRRYLGNKYRLLPFIVDVVGKECKGVNIVADIFAGTGAVSYAFREKQLITNDIMYSNYICQEAWFGVEEYSREKVIALICEYNDRSQCEDNYMTDNFGDTYFSRLDCSKIGFIRQNIEDKYQSNEINSRERAILITSLLYAMDKIANTCGHYDAYRQGVEFEKPLELFVPLPDENLNPNNRNYNEDANDLVQKIKADLVYIDPPYNSRQYCDAYHLLENVALWNKPEVFGVAKKMDRSYAKISDADIINER
jgi:adenine-specific DNA-methyltransferase